MKKSVVSLLLCVFVIVLNAIPIAYAATFDIIESDSGNSFGFFSDTTLVLVSCLGLILGFIALFFSIRSYRSSKGKLIVSNGHHSYYFDAKVFLDVGFRTDCAAAFTLNFDNRFNSPLVIDSVYMKIGDKIIRHVPDFKVDEFVSHNSSGAVARRISLESPSKKFPLRLGSYDYDSVGIRFPWFSEAVNKFGEPVTIKIYISTSRGLVRHEVMLKEVDRCLAHLSSNYSSAWGQ